MGKVIDVLTVGEPLVLFVAQQAGALEDVTSFERTVAGAEFNVVTGLARLGLKTAYISRVGDDAFGRYLSQAIAAQGIDHSQVLPRAPYSTGFMLKARSADGSDPAIEYFRRNSAASHLSVEDLDPDFCASARHIHLSGVFAGVSENARQVMLSLAQQARARGQTLSFDTNLRPRMWSSPKDMIACIQQLALLADWVMPGIDEGRLLTGLDTPQAISDWYLSKGVGAVFVKLGASGAYCASQNFSTHVPGVAVRQVVDTVGAGDGFAVGVLSALLEGQSLLKATQRGNAIGARVVQFPGDSDGLPTRRELDAMGA